MTNHRVCNNLRVTRRVSLVEQILLTLRSTWVHPGFLCAVHVAQSLVFCVVFCRSLFIRFCWSWRCLSISDLLLLSAHLISSSFSSCGNLNFHFGVLPCHLHRLLLVTFAYRIYLKYCSLDVRQQSINHITLLKFLSETKDKHSKYSKTPEIRRPCKESLKIAIGYLEVVNIVNQRRTDNKWPKENGQTMMHKILHRKLKIEQHEPHLKPGVKFCAPEG